MGYLKGWCHKMVCQLCQLVVSLGLNNPPRKGFTLVKARIKRYGSVNKGALDLKWLAQDFTMLWQTPAQMCSADHGIPRYLDSGLPRRKNVPQIA
jgi:hypothetical protein